MARHTRGLKRKKCSKAEELSRNAVSYRNDQDGQATMSNEEDGKNNSRLRHKRVKRGESGDGEDENISLEEGESPEDDIAQEEICLSVAHYRGRLGAAYYDHQKRTLHILEDTADSSHFDVIEMLIEQASPSLIITGSKSDENFIERVREITDSLSIAFQIRPKREFNAAKGYERLLTLPLFASLPSNNEDSFPSDADMDSRGGKSGEPQSAYDFARKSCPQMVDPSLQRWNAIIRMGNFSRVDPSSICISATGALLDHLARVKAIGELEDEGISGLDIRKIESVALNEFMHINADALSSLEIFDDESHASIHSSKTKEGLSLFGILNATRTSMGRKLLRMWFLRPSLSLAIIEARHDALACFLRPENLVTATSLHAHLKNIGNIMYSFSRICAGRTGIRDWQIVVKFVFHASLLKETLLELNHGTHVDVVRKLVACIDTALLKDIGNMVNETIDWEESFNAARVCVRPHIDDELDEWKRTLHGLDSFLSRVAAQIGDDMPIDYTDSLNVVYFPQLGFLICIPLKEEWKINRETHVPECLGDEIVFQERCCFCTEKSAYFKSPKMHDLDEHIGDLHPAIVDREIEIINTLEEKILTHDKMVSVICDGCAELDCLLSLAEASREYNYVRPEMTQDNLIDIKGGRHPLQERMVDTFVPNDTLIMGGKGMITETQENSMESDDKPYEARSVVVCTGANACGKSVYIKQIALTVYMAQIGCFVPATSAMLGITDKIFTRVQTKESVSKVQSAFMIDLNQVSFALRNMTPRSLLVLDEFGKGTLSTDGAGLFCATLTHCLSLGTSCPKVLAATHFHEIFHRDILDPSLPILFLHMEVLLTTEKPQISLNYSLDEGAIREKRLPKTTESITYLYRVAEGLCLQSYATKCASTVGMPLRIVERAEHVTRLLSSFAINELLDETMTPAEQNELEDAEAICRRFLAWDLSDSNTTNEHDARSKLREVLGIASSDE